MTILLLGVARRKNIIGLMMKLKRDEGKLNKIITLIYNKLKKLT